MRELPGFQQRVLDRLRDPARPRFGVVKSVTGSGIRRAIEEYIREVTTDALVLVLAPRREIIEQWAYRLRESVDVPVIVLDSSSTALQLLEQSLVPHGYVVLATYARASHGPSRLALSELNYGLIIHDTPFRAFSDKVEQLNYRAEHVIALTNQETTRTEIEWPLLADITSDDVTHDSGLATVVDVPFVLSNEERALRAEIVELLTEYGVSAGVPLRLASDSKPHLHTLLLDLTSSGDYPEKKSGSDLGYTKVDAALAERAWGLVDRIENAPADSRVRVLEQVVEKETSSGARCIVVAPTATDAYYIAGYLDGSGNRHCAVLTTEIPMTELAPELDGLMPSQPIIVTTPIFAHIERWAAGSTVVLWPSPRSRRSFGELPGTSDTYSEIRVLRLTEVEGKQERAR
ncbi:hypothetical protein DMH04_14530 [Kibdelosporangium aridum]|uniref:Helicase ATP-binding domain-containing protein n=1 Tax=Kibdelosporangium aridum TaxID=2030 RepID=A0A428ZE80_KIBAR|nr:DEAD/DEAH box helicase family protein [Kibdelosporangium aridum]RSM86369.1 hypothetical protein DMH04_14530 [Kibdelosporangium aridum]